MVHIVWQDQFQRFVNFFETKRFLQSTKTRVANNSWDSWKMSPWKTENEEIFRNFSFTSSSKSFFYNLLHLWTRSRLGLKSKFSNFFYLDININFTQFGPLSQHCAIIGTLTAQNLNMVFQYFQLFFSPTTRQQCRVRTVDNRCQGVQCV